MRSYHDMGGLPAGKVERSEHDYADWERRVDAMGVVLSGKKLLTVDQRRRAIETLTPENYQIIREAMLRVSTSSWQWHRERLRLAIYLITTSADFNVLR